MEQLQQGANSSSGSNDYVHNASVHSSLDYLYQNDKSSSIKSSSNLGGGGIGSGDASSSMILSRNGNDAKDRLSAGSKFLVRLTEKVIASDQVPSNYWNCYSRSSS